MVKRNEIYNRKTFYLLIIIICAIIYGSCSSDDPPTGEELRIEYQQRLDAGETPIEIYNNKDVPSVPEYFLGLYYAGGIIFYFDESTGKGLIASPEDLVMSEWGCLDTFIEDLPVTDGSGSTPKAGTRIGNGPTNTMLILEADCGKFSAARICDNYINDGYDDWFLPSIGELAFISYAGVHGEYWSSTIKDSTLYAYYFEYYLDRSYGSVNNCFCFPTIESPPGQMSTELRDVVKDIRAVREF